MKRRFFDAVTLYFTAIAVFGLCDVEVFPCFVWSRLIVFPYYWIVGSAFQLLEISLPFDVTIPDAVRNGVVIWLSMGRLVRKFVSEAEEEAVKDGVRLDLIRAPTLLEKLRSFVRSLRESFKRWWNSPYTKEKIWFTVFPPRRIWVDLKGDYSPVLEEIDGDGKRMKREYLLTMYWSLTPLTILKYSIASIACVLISRIVCAP